MLTQPAPFTDLYFLGLLTVALPSTIYVRYCNFAPFFSVGQPSQAPPQKRGLMPLS